MNGKLRNFLFLALIHVLFRTVPCFSQDNVGFGTLTPDSSAILELKSSDKGILIPRMSAAQRMAITNPAVGLLVYDTDSACFFFYKQPASWLSLCSLQIFSNSTGSAARAIIQVNNNGTGISSAKQKIDLIANFIPPKNETHWSIMTFLTLPAGNYYFEVNTAKYDSSSVDYTAGASSDSQSALIIQVFY